MSLLEEQRQFLGFPPEGYRDENLVRNGNILTARGNAYGPFCPNRSTCGTSLKSRIWC